MATGDDWFRKLIAFGADKLCKLTGGSFVNFASQHSATRFKGELSVQHLPAAKKRKR